MSKEQFNNELNYYLSLKMLQKMLDVGFITKEEFCKIDILNRKSFSPKLAQLMA